MVTTLTQLLPSPVPVARPVEGGVSPSRREPQAGPKAADTRSQDRDGVEESPPSSPKRSHEPQARTCPDAQRTRTGNARAKSRKGKGKRGPVTAIQAAPVPPALASQFSHVAAAVTKPFAALVAAKVATGAPVKPTVTAVKTLQDGPTTPAAPKATSTGVQKVAAEVQAKPVPKLVAAGGLKSAPGASQAAADPAPAKAQAQPQPATQPAAKGQDIEQLLAQAASKPVEAPPAAPQAAEPAHTVAGPFLTGQVAADLDLQAVPRIQAPGAKVARVHMQGGQRSARSTAQFQATPAAEAGAKGIEISGQGDPITAVAQVARAEPGPVDGQTGVSTTAPAADRAPQETMVSQVAEQIQANTDRLNQQIEIRLRPPELGTVRLTLQAEGSSVRGELKVSNPDTAAQLEVEAPNLFRRLADGGIQMRRLDISLENDTAGNPGESGLGTPHGGREHHTAGGHGRFDADGAPSVAAYRTAPGPIQAATYVTDRSINVWM